MYDLIIYLRKVNKCGGVKTATLNLCKALRRSSIKALLVYKDIQDPLFILDFAQYIDTKQLRLIKGIKADKCLIASNYPIPAQIRAKSFIQWVHSDYEKYKLDLKNVYKIDKYIGVSDYVSQKTESVFGVKCDTIYNITNPSVKKLDRKILRLVTNSRISPEKGFGRMKLLTKAFRENNIPFHWTVCGNNEGNVRLGQTIIDTFSDTQEVDFVGYKDDIKLRLEQADYLVQLSDWEGCSYSVLEALQLRVPVIVTNYPGADELVEDGRNGYTVNMDMSDVNVNKIYNEIPKINTNFEIKEDKWLEILKS